MSAEQPGSTPRPRVLRLGPDGALTEGGEQRPAEPTEPAPVAPPAQRPRAFRIDAGSDAAAGVTVADQEDAYSLEAEALAAAAGDGEAVVELAQRRGMADRLRLGWGGVLGAAVAGLASLAFGTAVWGLVDTLFARVPALGWLAIGLLGLAVLALVALIARETVGVLRQRRVAALHKRLADARSSDDAAAARGAVADLVALYAGRPDTVAGRETLGRTTTDIIDGRDLVDLAERTLMPPLDRRAQRAIADAAKRVSAVTAISPRAAIGLLFVVGQTATLIRQLAEIYSGRPGLLGFVRLARSVGTHLVVTGSMALGDGILQQAVGHGIAAKISARLGEGVLNGMLTTRVGLSAMAVCRPMPFAALRQPGVKEVAPFLLGGDRKG